MLDDFRYNDEDHTYWFGQGQVTGATHAINAAGYGDLILGRAHAKNFTYAGVRGKATHSMCHLDDMGVADRYDMDENLMGYLRAWRKFKQDYQFIPDPDCAEVPLGHRACRFGVTPDSAGNSILGFIAVERKSRAILRKDYLQVEAQKMAIKDVLGKPIVGGRVVELRPNGEYHAPDPIMKPARARALFLSAVDIANDIIANGK